MHLMDCMLTTWMSEVWVKIKWLLFWNWSTLSSLSRFSSITSSPTLIHFINIDVDQSDYCLNCNLCEHRSWSDPLPPVVRSCLWNQTLWLSSPSVCFYGIKLFKRTIWFILTALQSLAGQIIVYLWNSLSSLLILVSKYSCLSLGCACCELLYNVMYNIYIM